MIRNSISGKYSLCVNRNSNSPPPGSTKLSYIPTLKKHVTINGYAPSFISRNLSPIHPILFNIHASTFVKLSTSEWRGFSGVLSTIKEANSTFNLASITFSEFRYNLFWRQIIVSISSPQMSSWWKVDFEFLKTEMNWEMPFFLRFDFILRILCQGRVFDERRSPIFYFRGVICFIAGWNGVF